MDKGLLIGLIAEIEKELEMINELRKEMKQIKSFNSTLLRRSTGSILHDFYNCCERIFRKIAVEINGGYEDSDKWHKGLLFKMTIPVKGLRTAVISEELAAELDEYLAFRHLFRNIYGFELKGDRIGYLAKKFDKVADKFITETTQFLTGIKKQIMPNKQK